MPIFSIIDSYYFCHTLTELYRKTIRSWKWEKLKTADEEFSFFIIKNRMFQHQFQWQVKMYLFVFISWSISCVVCIYMQYFFDVVRNKLQTIIPAKTNQKKIKRLRKEYAMWTCFNFWPIKNTLRKLWANGSWIMTSIQIYREWSWLATFLRVHANSKKVSYFPW